MSQKKDITVSIDQEHKPNVTVSSCELPEPMGLEVVRLDIHKGQEQRFRLRLPNGVENRISTSAGPHFQSVKRHKDVALYVVHRGWLCAIWEEDGKQRQRFAFAKRPGGFYLEVPGKTWYALYLSKDVALTYTSSDTETGDLDGVHIKLPSEAEMLADFGRTSALSDEDVQDIVREAYKT